MFSRTALRRLFSSGHGHGHGHGHAVTGPAKLPKVAERSVWINVKNAYGVHQRVVAFPGEPLHEVLLRNSVHGHSALCEGGDKIYRAHERPVDPLSTGPVCGDCQVLIPEPWFTKTSQEIGPAYEAERDAMMSNIVQKPNARLACCIPIESWMNQMVVEVLPTPNYNDGQ